ncbi:MAG TPA: MlaD family protein [Thermoanaerobaculia bacterium]|nr:MlaD family protein [Thermoanaerobaculia bacterium]
MRADVKTKTRVGVILFAAFVLLAGALLFIGGTKGFFVRRTSYFARFANTQGIVGGNQVRLAGVIVGAVRGIEVPRVPGQDLTIHFDIERKYQHLVKTDSRAEIKTIGLLGDKYLEVTPGSTDKPDLEPDHEIIAFRGAELEKILAGSGDLVDNVVAISKSLKNILGRTEKGEGFLGEITSESENGQALSRSLRQTLESVNGLMKDVRQGKGLVGRLLNDEKAGEKVLGELGSATASLNRILANVEKGTATGEGLVPALLSDPEGKKKFFAMVDSLQITAEGLATFSKDLKSGNGLLGQLVSNGEFSKEFLDDLKKLSSHLANVAAKLDSTEGTAGKLIADPAVHAAIDDILVGINESKLLRWLIRDRQRSGIKKRYDDAQKGVGATPRPTP